MKLAAIVVLAGVCTAASVNRDEFLRAVQSGDGNAAAAMIQQGADVNAREANGTRRCTGRFITRMSRW